MIVDTIFLPRGFGTSSDASSITIDALKKININARGYLISSEFIREVNDNKIPFEEVPIKTIYTPETQAKGTNVTEALKILIQMIKHQL